MPGRVPVAPIYSKLFFKAIDSRNIAPDSACHAISDVFHISLQVVEMAKVQHPQSTSLPSAPIPSTINIPSWMNENKNSGSVEHA